MEKNNENHNNGNKYKSKAGCLILGANVGENLGALRKIQIPMVAKTKKKTKTHINTHNPHH